MMMIRCANDDRIHFLFHGVEHNPIIFESFRFGKTFEHTVSTVPINVTQPHDVF